MRQLDPEYERFGQKLSASFGWTVSLYVLVVDICLAVSFPISIPRLVVILLLLVASAYLNPFIERQVKGFLYRTFGRRTVDIAAHLLIGFLLALCLFAPLGSKFSANNLQFWGMAALGIAAFIVVVQQINQIDKETKSDLQVFYGDPDMKTTEFTAPELNFFHPVDGGHLAILGSDPERQSKIREALENSLTPGIPIVAIRSSERVLPLSNFNNPIQEFVLAENPSPSDTEAFATDIFNALLHYAQQYPHTLIYCDDISDLLCYEPIASLVTKFVQRGRKTGMAVLLTSTDEGALDNCSSDLRSDILPNLQRFSVG